MVVALQPFLVDTIPDLSYQALRALGESDEPAAEATLAQAIKDHDAFIKSFIKHGRVVGTPKCCP
jgi:hypothetical protein